MFRWRRLADWLIPNHALRETPAPQIPEIPFTPDPDSGAEASLFAHTRSLSMDSVPAEIRGGIPEGVRLLGAPAMWKAGYDGRGMVIANIDSGVDGTHPDLLFTTNGLAKIISFRDYVNSDGRERPGTAAYDDNGHGTHVAGIMAANGAIKGVAPGARMRVYKVLDRWGYGTRLRIYQAIRQAIADGCHVINLSLGAWQRIPEWADAIREAQAAGIVVTVAAGNDGPGFLSWPACEPEVISVGGVGIDPVTGLPTFWWFSNSNNQVDLSAHAVRVLSTMPGGKYAYMNGTSMAAPHIAGAAAILIQQGLEALEEPMTEPAVWQGLKTRGIRLPNATREQWGAGFFSFWPSLPLTREVKFRIGTAGRWVNGVYEDLDVAPFIQNGRTYTPTRHVAERHLIDVGWNPDLWEVSTRQRWVKGLED